MTHMHASFYFLSLPAPEVVAYIHLKNTETVLHGELFFFIIECVRYKGGTGVVSAVVVE